MPSYLKTHLWGKEILEEMQLWMFGLLASLQATVSQLPHIGWS